MDMKANTSNNTVYADSKGISLTGMEILYLSETNINWSKVVDGTTSTTEWKAYMKFRKQFIPTILQMAGYKCNSTPFSAAGIKVKKENYLPYMAPDGENFRAINAVRLLSKGENYTLDKVIADGYDTKLTAFEVLIPALILSFEKNNLAKNPL
jgi:hypothetical protein